MTQLSVNLNKIALLRNARSLNLPNVGWAAQTCIDAGAHGLTVHPRPDERHIRMVDVYELAERLQDSPSIELNIEGNPMNPLFMKLVQDVKPTQVTLVPDSPHQVTSDHGWNIQQNGETLQPLINTIQSFGSRVSLFMEPDPAQIRLIKTLGVNENGRIELYTEPYATAFRENNPESVLAKYAQAAAVAQSENLGVNAGHDLNLENLPLFLSILNILEVSIGHALIAEALKFGLYSGVQAYLQCLP